MNLQNGVYKAQLGSLTDLSSVEEVYAPTNGNQRYLQVEVCTDPANESLPESCVSNTYEALDTDPSDLDIDRSQINSTLFALNSSKLDGYDANSFVLKSELSTLETDPSVKSFAKSNLPTCSEGQVLKSDGTNLTCVVDQDIDTNTQLTEAQVDSFTSNNGYLTAETDPTVNSLGRADLTCTNNQIPKWNATTASWVCSNDSDTSVTYTPGDGLKLLGSVLSVNTTSPTNIQTTQLSTAKQIYDFVANYVSTNLSNHTTNQNNPHNTTKAQVGLGNLTNDAQLAIANNLSDLDDIDTAKTNLELNNVDNTADTDKPISTATQIALDSKTNTLDLSTVATSGSYTDLIDIPTTITADQAAAIIVNTDKFSFDSASSTRLANTSGINTGDETLATIKTKLDITNLSGDNTGDETTTTIGSLINNSIEETSIAAADMFTFMDSSSSNLIKKLSWTNFKTILQNYFNTLYEPIFSKNTAFNKNFGTAAGTVVQGNDSRINNGQTAYGWGNHASAGYLTSTSSLNASKLTGSLDSPTINNIMKLTPTDNPTACSASIKGSIYYNNTDNKPCYCDGTGWKFFEDGTECTPSGEGENEGGNGTYYINKSVALADLDPNYILSNYTDIPNNKNYWTATGEVDWNDSAGSELTSTNPLYSDNLVGLWHLNGNALDSSGNGNDGTAMNGVNLEADGLWDTKAGEFDGVDDYVETNQICYSYPCSVSVWIKKENISNTGDIISFVDYDAGNSGSVYRTSFTSQGSIRISGYKEGVGNFSMPEVAIDEGWNQVVIIFTESNNHQIFINGENKLHDTINYSTPDWSKLKNTFIGSFRRGDHTYDKYLDGSIEEVAIWNKALTESEVTELYNSQKENYVDESLVAYYKFNGDATDSSGNENNGTLMNGASADGDGMWDTGALELDGVDDYVQTNDILFDHQDETTISMWIKINNNNNLTAPFCIANTGYGGEGHNNCIEISSENKVLFYYYDGNQQRITSTSSIFNKEWHQISVKYSNSNIYLYVDGNLENTKNINEYLLTGYGVIGYIDSNEWGVEYNNFDGSIDEVKIYNRALTAEEIEDDYNSFLGSKFVSETINTEDIITTPSQIKINEDLGFNFGSELSEDESYFYDENLVGLWHLNGDATDSSGNGNDGTVNGANLDSDGLWGTKAGEFDGVGDYVECNSYILPSGVKTISVWAKIDGLDSGDDSVFMGAGSGTTDWVFYYNDNYEFKFNNPNGTSISYPINLFDHQWKHFIYTFDGSIQKLYINGTKMISNNGTNTSSTNNILIGYAKFEDRFFNGLIDEVAIWDKALTDEEVLNLYRKGASRLDLDINACTDSTCNTYTDTVSYPNADNNTWYSLSNLDQSQYYNIETSFKPITELQSYDAGRFYVNSYLEDYDFNYDD